MATKTKKSKRVSHKPSHRQVKIYHTFTKEEVNILIEAVAGSGKTTVLLELLKLCDGDTLFLAFNKDIQTDIQNYIDDNGIEHGQALTLHAMGYAAIREAYESVKLYTSKSYKASLTVKERNSHLFRKDGFKLQMMLKDMFDVSRMYLTDVKDEIIEYMIAMDKFIHEDSNIARLWDEMLELREESYNGDEIVIDFIDMIYLPVRFGHRIPYTPQYLFIDEAQDLNMAQHTMIDNLIAQGDVKRWVAVGDRKQSIYNFAGSHSSSFDLFKERDNVVELPLDICYRCPKAIVAEANKVYDVMKGFKTNDGVVDRINDVSKVKRSSMVVCRNTAPLLKLYFQLVANGTPAFFKGEDILNKILNFVNPMKFETIERIESKTATKIDKYRLSKSSLQRLQATKLEENLENLNILVEGRLVTRRDKGEVLISRLKAIFKEEKDGVMLCTIHKAKGLEEDVVYILREDLIPSKYAKSPSQLEQEENLRYVARTRAKKELYYLNPEEKDNKKK